MRKSNGSDMRLHEMRWWPSPENADGTFEVRLLGAAESEKGISAAYVRAQFVAAPLPDAATSNGG